MKGVCFCCKKWFLDDELVTASWGDPGGKYDPLNNRSYAHFWCLVRLATINAR